MISNWGKKGLIRRKPGGQKKITVKQKQIPENDFGPKEKDLESLIREFVPIIKFIALRLAMRMPNGLNIEDLISVGTLGLLDALGKFDPTRNIKFRTYAEFRIRGAMLDEIRAMDWVPRSIRKQIGKIQHATNEYTRRNGRPPTEAELAGVLEMEAEKIDKVLLQAKGTVLLSLEDIRAQDDEPQSVLNGLVDQDQPNPLEALLIEDRRKILADSLERLPERQRLVLNLYHFDELTMKEIGAVLNVTESRICQLHGQAMIRLKALLHSRIVRK
ncbi:MAG: FliA/WhiG family RNA polymerase sigma factor [Nitrospirota bacterium]|nr:MAG: FliA/WhiG family RNA polymerase sigma factor [Nitrospirota bacterium]